MFINQLKLFCFLFFLNSCYFGAFDFQYNTSYNLPSVGDSSNPSSSTYFYFDVDKSRYKSERELAPYYEISTTEEYGDGNRNSVSNCEISLIIAEEDEDLILSESTETLVCILDLLEGDIQVKDLHLTFNFPEGMCSYVSTGIPWHFNHEILEGPVVEEKTCGEDAGEGCETTYCDTNRSDFCKTEAEDLCEGEVKCCQGGDKGDGEPWEPEQECFGGPALIAEGDIALPVEDFYKYLVRELPEGGLKEDFTLPNVISINGGQSSMTHANYVKRLDRAPEDLRNVKRDQLPIFLQSSNHYKYAPRLFFEFDCLDQGSESLHKILVMIREWNTLEEFWNFYLDGGNDTADPDVEGFEGEDCAYEDRTILNESPGLCNDESDMDDLEEYPKIEYGSE